MPNLIIILALCLFPAVAFGAESIVDLLKSGKAFVDEETGTVEEFLDRIARNKAAIKEEKKTFSGPAFWPSVWPVSGYITSPFGMRKSPFTGKLRFHAGMDIGAPMGTPIKAPARGVVIFAGRDGGYGNSVEVYHCGNMSTRFAHMSKIKAVSGQIVNKGDVLGYVGSTGRSTGPHLHYEVLIDGLPTNPMRHIIEQEG